MSISQNEVSRFGLFDQPEVAVSENSMLGTHSSESVSNSLPDKSTKSNSLSQSNKDINQDSTAILDTSDTIAGFSDPLISPPATSNDTAIGDESTYNTDSNGKIEVSNLSNIANPYARRRMAVVGSVTALLLLGISGQFESSLPTLSGIQTPLAATPSKPVESTAMRANTILSNALLAAERHHKQYNTYRGLILNSDTTSVLGENMVVISAIVDGSCWYSALVPGYNNPPRWDATATRCNPDRLIQLQKDIDKSE